MSSGTSGGYRHMFRAVTYREVILFLRYPFEALGNVVVFTVMFTAIFLGGRTLAGQAMANSIEGIVVGFFLWILAIGSYGDMAGTVVAEAGWGTLERHYLTPFGFGPVLIAKAAGSLVTHVAYAGIMLVVMMLITGTTLSVDLVTVVPIALLTVASSFGIGIAFGGLAVLYKNVSSFMELVNFLLVGMIAAPVFENDLLLALPLAQGSSLLQRTMRDGVRLWEFSPTDLAILAATGVGYLLAGYLVFSLCQRRARKLGVLGDY